MLSKIIKEISEVSVHIIIDTTDIDDEIIFNDCKSPQEYDIKLKEIEDDFKQNIEVKISGTSKEQYGLLFGIREDIKKLSSYYFMKGDLLYHSNLKKFKGKVWEENDTPYYGDIEDPEISVYLNYQRAFLRKIYHFLSQKIYDLREQNPELAKTIKLKWIGSPSQFGYLFSELVDKGFIELPNTKGKPSFKALAKMCYEVFEIDCKISSLEKELSPTTNSLAHHNKKEFKISRLKDMY